MLRLTKQIDMRCDIYHKKIKNVSALIIPSHQIRSRSSYGFPVPLPQHLFFSGRSRIDLGPSSFINIGKNRIINFSKRTFAEGGGDSKGGGEDPTTNEIVLTPGQKVAAGTQLTLWFGAFVAAVTCAYYIGKELFPSKMSPNSVFNKSVEVVRQNDQVLRRFGAPLKFFGRDHGGHREGRRNFIEHTEYTDKDDGTKRTRVRYNLEGQHGKAYVFAEASSDMPSGEFAYVMVQCKSNGSVITVVDNRSAMLVKRMAGGKKEGQEAFSSLLGGTPKP